MQGTELVHATNILWHSVLHCPLCNPAATIKPKHVLQHRSGPGFCTITKQCLGALQANNYKKMVAAGITTAVGDNT